MAKKGGLGKGLDALIPGGEHPSDSTFYVPIGQIVPNPRQPRRTIQNDELTDLSASIREHGILQPLIVTQSDAPDTYVLIAGERRWRAAELAGIDMVPVILRQATDQQMLELALIENIQREDLTPLEAAEAYALLSQQFHLSHEEIALRVGKSRVAVTNTMRLLNLSEQVRAALAEGRIAEGHARALLGLSNHQAQSAALRTVLDNDLTVRQTEKLVQRLTGERPAARARRSSSPEILALEDRLLHQYGTKVSLKHGNKGGTLTFYYYSDEELDSLIDQILKD